MSTLRDSFELSYLFKDPISEYNQIFVFANTGIKTATYYSDEHSFTYDTSLCPELAAFWMPAACPL